ncbi:hypothetical protein K402DRAFT_208061 [Aulographum hederae CBS 113979]|uniref:Fungal N-terminal domain-containing protein n=1 Tax=Aulographum hederae CBS 113979 TaxID=1176131 RepID=A0A6G1GMZ9_9PEZI|nr:hypothetical protein K402DRAFT_208061 [Aulographum hederae CBS 113979]
MSAAGFSVAANAFSVCGLLDITIRGVIEITVLYDRVRSAFQDVQSLLTTLGTLTQILFETQSFVTEHERSLFAIEDNHTLPPALDDTLRDCQRTLADLRILAESSSRKADQGWWVQSFRQTQRAMRNRKVSEYRATIETQKATLIECLARVGRSL